MDDEGSRVSLKTAIVRAGDAQHTILNYEAKEIAQVVSSTAMDFVEAERGQSSDFKVSDIVAQQTGIRQLQKNSMEQQIEDQALVRIKDIQELAYKEAYELGKTEGNERAFEEMKVILQQQIEGLGQLLNSIEKMKTNLMQQNEGSLVRLVYEIAKRVVLAEIEQKDDLVLNILKQIVPAMQGDEQMVVNVSARDFAVIEKSKGKLGREFEFLERLKLQAGETVANGGCVVETNYGTIDATIEQRLLKVWETLDSKVPRQHKVDGT